MKYILVLGLALLVGCTGTSGPVRPIVDTALSLCETTVINGGTMDLYIRDDKDIIKLECMK